jgi:sulfite oxidase
LENFFIRSEKPFNAETKPSILIQSFLTPVEKFYVRNHMHVPFVNIKEYKLEIGNQKSSFSLSYDDLKDKYQTYTITSAIQCAGNRRHAMNNEQQGSVQGTPWYVGAIGNARWTGVKLRDVLQSFDLDKEGKHVQFFGLDCDTSQRYNILIIIFLTLVFFFIFLIGVMEHQYQ